MQELGPQRELFSISQLRSEDLNIFKSIRLEALQKEPQFFGSNFERENAFTDPEWLSALTDKGRAYFALSADKLVVGVTGIFKDEQNPSQAILIASYIRSEYRRMGGSDLLYRARLDWARDNGFSEVIVSHRASNEASKRSNQKHGFQYSHSTPHIWNDGVTEDEVYYRLKL